MNGIIESRWKPLINCIASFIDNDHRNFSHIATLCTHSYNSAPCRALDWETPYFCIFGRDKVLAVDEFDERNERYLCDREDAETWLLHIQQLEIQVWEYLRGSVEKARKAAYEYHLARSRMPPSFQIGDLCLLKFQPQQPPKGLTRKLMMRHIVCRIRLIQGSVVVVSDLQNPRRLRLVSLDHIKPCLFPPLPCLVNAPDHPSAPVISNDGKIPNLPLPPLPLLTGETGSCGAESQEREEGNRGEDGGAGGERERGWGRGRETEEGESGVSTPPTLDSPPTTPPPSPQHRYNLRSRKI